MIINSVGNHLIKNLRLCLSTHPLRRWTGHTVKSCRSATCIYILTSLKKRNGPQYCLSSSLLNTWPERRMCLVSIRLYSGKIQRRRPKAAVENQAEDWNTHTGRNEDLSVLLAPHFSQSVETGRSHQLELPVENFNAEWDNVSPTKRSSQEMFFEQLSKCNSPSDVLDLVSESTLTWKMISNSLTTMWETTKKMSEDQKHYERRLMFEHPVFEKMCQEAMREARFMKFIDLSYSLLALVKIGVSQRSRLVQTLLRVTQERLNEFDERALSVLANCLQQMESCKNVEALRGGLRLLMEQRVPEIKTVIALQTTMRCVGKDAPLPLKKKLERKALSLVSEFTLPNAQHMFGTLAAMGHRSHLLLKACTNKVVENIHCIPYWRLVHILQSCKDLQYRDPSLLQAIGDHLASNLDIWQLKQLITFLLLFGDLGYRHVELMDAYIEKVLPVSESLTLKDVLYTLRAYSQVNHQPKRHREQFLDILTGMFESYLPRLTPLDLLRGVHHLCLMGNVPKAALRKLFEEDVLSELHSTANPYRERNTQLLQHINLCLELDHPSHPRLADASLEKPSDRKVCVNSEVQRAVYGILGDSSLYQQGLVLKNEYFIDFEITLDQERKNVISLPQNEDIRHDVRRVAVLCAPISAFCLGTTHPKDKLAMKIRHLEALGYHIAVVPEHKFGKLSEDERFTFLRSMIFAE
uniref:RAP domain-containing protein n=1 Tax=Callorhinchus milii TaxID=7868 RepID=A0A4W3HA01_CALMI|eukprot:gi/632946982/ref/XP_007888830.1/ PREDICTED: FAST kinase domain-containing protein 2 [Callorhinchus milii]